MKRIWLIRRATDEIYVQQGDAFETGGVLRDWKWLEKASKQDLDAIGAKECVVTGADPDSRLHGHVSIKCVGANVEVIAEELSFAEARNNTAIWLSGYADAGSEAAQGLLKEVEKLDCYADLYDFVRNKCNVLVM